MYQMNTRAREVPTVNRSTSSIGATPGTDVAPALPTFVSRGLQTDLEPPTSASQTTYFEKQPAQVDIRCFSISFNVDDDLDCSSV